jgi:hypothetical protein
MGQKRVKDRRKIPITGNSTMFALNGASGRIARIAKLEVGQNETSALQWSFEYSQSRQNHESEHAVGDTGTWKGGKSSPSKRFLFNVDNVGPQSKDSDPT